MLPLNMHDRALSLTTELRLRTRIKAQAHLFQRNHHREGKRQNDNRWIKLENNNIRNQRLMSKYQVKDQNHRISEIVSKTKILNKQTSSTTLKLLSQNAQHTFERIVHSNLCIRRT